MTSARARAWTTRSGVERTNHCAFWPSLIRTMQLTAPFYDFLLGRWTTTSWRNYHQTFLVKTPGWRTCEFIPCFIYAKGGLNPNLLNREVIFYLQMIEESFFANINAISNGDAQYNWIHGSLVLTSAQHHAPLLVYLKVNFFAMKWPALAKFGILDLSKEKEWVKLLKN